MIRNAFAVAVVSAMGAVPSTRAEVIGDFKVIDAPIAATQTGGPSLVSNWLNVTPTAVSVAEAFTGFSLIDNGFQVNAGTSIDLFFDAGVAANHGGPDLVLLDADAGLNVYLVTVFDQDEPIIRSISATVDTGVTRDYFSSGGGPSQHSILAATIELSTFGIPDGGAINHVRVFSEGPDCTLLGVGVLLSACAEDLNGDGAIDLADLTKLLSSFGSSHGDDAFEPRADLDADGSIGLADLADLLSHFGDSC
jgi:hypothetical protein